MLFFKSRPLLFYYLSEYDRPDPKLAYEKHHFHVQAYAFHRLSDFHMVFIFAIHDGIELIYSF